MDEIPPFFPENPFPLCNQIEEGPGGRDSIRQWLTHMETWAEQAENAIRGYISHPADEVYFYSQVIGKKAADCP